MKADGQEWQWRGECVLCVAAASLRPNFICSMIVSHGAGSERGCCHTASQAPKYEQSTVSLISESVCLENGFTLSTTNEHHNLLMTFHVINV